MIIPTKGAIRIQHQITILLILFSLGPLKAGSQSAMAFFAMSIVQR